MKTRTMTSNAKLRGMCLLGLWLGLGPLAGQVRVGPVLDADQPGAPNGQENTKPTALLVQNYAVIDLGAAPDVRDAVLDDQGNGAFAVGQPQADYPEATSYVVHRFAGGVPGPVTTYPAVIDNPLNHRPQGREPVDQHGYGSFTSSLLLSGNLAAYNSYYNDPAPGSDGDVITVHYTGCVRTPGNLKGDDEPTPGDGYRADTIWEVYSSAPTATPPKDGGHDPYVSEAPVVALGEKGNLAYRFSYRFNEPPDGPPPSTDSFARADAGVATKLVANGVSYYFDADRDNLNPLPNDTPTVKYVDQDVGVLQVTDSGRALLGVAGFYGVFYQGGVAFEGLPALNGATGAFGLNEQGWCLIYGDTASGAPNTTGALWHAGAATRFVDLLKGGPWEHQLQSIRPQCLSNQNTVDKSIYAVTTLQDLSVPPVPPSKTPPVEFAVWRYQQAPPVPPATTGKWIWQPSQMHLPEGMSLAAVLKVNRSGEVLAIGNAGTGKDHALLLLPIYVTADANDNYQVDLSEQDSTESNASSNAAVRSDSGNVSQSIPPDQMLRYVRFGLWDHAFDASGAIRNGNADAANFVSGDSRCFYYSIHAKVPTQGSAPGTVTVHWYTDSDHPSTDTITLSQSSKDPTLYSSKALMLIADDADNIPVNTGLPGGGDAGPGQADHRLRKAKLGDKVWFKLTPAGAGAASSIYPLPIFDTTSGPDAPDGVKTLDVQIVNTRSIAGGTVAPDASGRQGYIASITAAIKSCYAVAGIKANVIYSADSDVLYVPGSVELNNFDSGNTANSMSSPLLTSNESTVVNLLRGKYKGENSAGKTAYVIVVGAFNDKRLFGYSYSTSNVSSDPYIAKALNCCFVAQVPPSPSIMTTPHELGHLLLNRLPADAVAIYDKATGQTTRGHYVGNQEGFNLMYGGGLFGNGAASGSKRLWNDGAHFDGVHSGTATTPTAPYQLDYLRKSPMLH